MPRTLLRHSFWKLNCQKKKWVVYVLFLLAGSVKAANTLLLFFLLLGAFRRHPAPACLASGWLQHKVNSFLWNENAPYFNNLAMSVSRGFVKLPHNGMLVGPRIIIICILTTVLLHTSLSLSKTSVPCAESLQQTQFAVQNVCSCEKKVWEMRISTNFLIKSTVVQLGR